jgi:hypothetical protein
MNNFLHDWFYDSGFDEASGNAQIDNFGRGGIGGDSIRAEAGISTTGITRTCPYYRRRALNKLYLWDGALDTCGELSGYRRRI